MITIHDLLEDKEYVKFFLTKPDPPRYKKPNAWRVYVQREVDGRWGKKDFNTYPEAFAFFKQIRRRCHDATIHSRGLSFAPPQRWVKLTRHGRPVMAPGKDGKQYQAMKLVVWKPRLVEGDQAHTWCIYCRRPVELRWYTSHHTFKGKEFNQTLKRCPICGASERLLGAGAN